MSSSSGWSSAWSSVRRLMPLVLGTAALAMIWGRFVIEGGRQLANARTQQASGLSIEATHSYLDALRTYVPGSPYERQALDGLVAMAERARASGDPTAERRALEAIRSGLLGTRSFIIPHRARLAATDARLRDMDQADGARPPVDLVLPRHHSGRTVTPSGFVSALIVLFGMATWVAAVALLVRQGIEGRRTRAQKTSPDVALTAPPPAALRLLVPVLFVALVALFLVGLKVA